MAPVLQEIGRQIAESVLIVSVAAGVKISTIEALLPGRRVIRVMPNTPVAVGAGMSAITKGKYATESDVELVLSRAFMWRASFQGATSHFAS